MSMMSAPPATAERAYDNAAGILLFVDPSEKESGVMFSVPIMYVLRGGVEAVEPDETGSFQYDAVGGTGVTCGNLGRDRSGSGELRLSGYRGKGTTL